MGNRVSDHHTTAAPAADLAGTMATKAAGPHPVTPSATRRRALGLAAGLFGAGAMGFRLPVPESALRAPADPYDPEAWTDLTGSCEAYYDKEYEEQLAAVDESQFDLTGQKPPDTEPEWQPDAEPEWDVAAETEAGRGAGAPSRPWARPLNRRYRVTVGYGVRGNWLAGHHTGIDLAVPHGTPVWSVSSGVVVLARWSGDYGRAVTIRMPDGRYVLYAHLSRISVRQGTRMHAGRRIGNSGATGRATGPHLHLEVRARRGYGSDINPVKYLAQRGVRL